MGAAFWSDEQAALERRLGSSAAGLSLPEAETRLFRVGPNQLRARLRTGPLLLLLGQFKSPLVLLLLGAAGLSLTLGDAVDSLLIAVIVFASGLLGFFQERRAAKDVERLVALVEVRATVLRDGAPCEIPVANVVPGDVVVLGCGDVVPADARVIEARDLFVDQASLTGESYPTEKQVGLVAADAPLAARTNAVWFGTHVVSGTGRALVVSTGRVTELGHIAERLRLRPPETEFERGVRRFGHLLLELTLLLVLGIFAANVYFARPVLESLLFAVALAVGLTPQLLPAIISVNLAHGARRMAERRVVVKRLSSIENFGSMTVLCTDKTGTVTESVARLASSLAPGGSDSPRPLLFARLNAAHHTGFRNPIDQALINEPGDLPKARKLDEVPYDFRRKRLSLLLDLDGEKQLVTKGAVENVLAVCSHAEVGAEIVSLESVRQQIDELRQHHGEEGFRLLAVARKPMSSEIVSAADERDLILVGILAFAAPLKPGVGETVARLQQLGVGLKILTGDDRRVSQHVAAQLGLGGRLLTGPELEHVDGTALLQLVRHASVFAELEPQHKERIVAALRHSGEVVGFLGDGVNDASALHVADVGLSVEGAVDVAKEAADLILLEKDLAVLVDGIEEGRRTFANTLKYVFMATSANFGNMFSMAGASLFLPFLPLLPTQVLLTNLLTDLPEMTIANDRVDDELVARPRRWDIRFIRRFMMTFGLVSSIFDYLTFAVLLWLLHANQIEFRTGWFIESVVSAASIVLVIRTRRPPWRSRPGRWLAIVTAAVVAAAVALPFTPLGRLFGFAPPRLAFVGMVFAIVALYVAAAELAKRLFYRLQGTGAQSLPSSAPSPQ